AGQALPAGDLHGRGTGDSADRFTLEEPVEHVEADLPARGAPRDETAIDGDPEMEARAAIRRLELPPEIIASPRVLQKPRRLGALYDGLRDLRRRRPDRGELYGSHGGQIA